MSEEHGGVSSRFGKVPALVLESATGGEVRVLLNPDQTGSSCDIPADLVPPDLRAPNTPLWVTYDHALKRALFVWKR